MKEFRGGKSEAAYRKSLDDSLKALISKFPTYNKHLRGKTIEGIKGEKPGSLNRLDSIHLLQFIFSKITNQSDLKILRQIRLDELVRRLHSCLKGLETYGEIPTRKESFNHQIVMMANLIKKGGHFTEMPIKNSPLENMTFKEVINAYEFDNFEEINISEQESLNWLLQYCFILSFYNENNEYKMNDEEKREYNIYEYLITGKAWEAFGYWTAKLEMMKQNKKNVETRTTKKEKRKAELKEWMKTMEPKEYRLKAMQKWDIVERTVLNYLQEIEGEKTA